MPKKTGELFARLRNRVKNRRIKREVQKMMRQKSPGVSTLMPAKRQPGRPRAGTSPVSGVAPVSAQLQAAMRSGNIGVDYYGLAKTQSKDLIRQQTTSGLRRREHARWFRRRR